MHIAVNQIRDLELIEKELSSNPAGVLSLMLNNEKITQIATTYIYRDKNIFIFFDGDDELFDKIQFETGVTFTILKYGKVKKEKDMEFDPTYNLFSISIAGLIRKVDEQKLLEEIQQSYIQKYKKTLDGDINYAPISKAIIIDSEEIQAFEEMGG